MFFCIVPGLVIRLAHQGFPSDLAWSKRLLNQNENSVSADIVAPNTNRRRRSNFPSGGSPIALTRQCLANICINVRDLHGHAWNGSAAGVRDRTTGSSKWS